MIDHAGAPFARARMQYDDPDVLLKFEERLDGKA